MYPLDDDPEEQPDARALVERAGGQLDDDLQTLGVYVQHKGLAVQHTPFGQRAVVVIDAILGDRALSERALSPTNNAIDDTLDAIEAGLVEQEAQRHIDELFGGLHGGLPQRDQGRERDPLHQRLEQRGGPEVDRPGSGPAATGGVGAEAEERPDGR